MNDSTHPLSVIVGQLDPSLPPMALLIGTDGDEQLEGSDVADRILGLGGNDGLIGNAGSDLLEGGAGNDVLIAFDGDDWLFGEGPLDRRARGNDLLDGGNGDDLLVGGNDDDTLLGSNGNDTLVGDYQPLDGAPFDTAPDAAGYFAGDDKLAGLAGDDRLYGNEGNDLLDGGSGGDLMVGGLGDDRYVLDSQLDRIVEAAGEGTDTVVVGAEGYQLPDFIENVELADGIIRGIGNSGDNHIVGNDLANDMRGFGGADVLEGGRGDDYYIVDSGKVTVIERADEGNDRVDASVSYVLPAQVELLVLQGDANLDGTGNALANLLVGNAGRNALDGGAGDDGLFGGDGNDRLIGGAGLDTLGGDGGSDTLIGGTGRDSLDGGSGADTMIGGTDDDTYVVDDARDCVVEQCGQGHDWIFSSVSHTLEANVEGLLLTGSAAINGIGNALANPMTGNDAANLLEGRDGDDSLEGRGGADRLLGGRGQDFIEYDAADLAGSGTRIDGGRGTDTLRLDGGETLDLTTLRDDAVVGIEQIHLTGSGNVLRFSRSDVLALSDTDVLRVTAFDAQQTVELVGRWQQGHDVRADGTLYHSYFDHGAALLLDARVDHA